MVAHAILSEGSIRLNRDLKRLIAIITVSWVSQFGVGSILGYAYTIHKTDMVLLNRMHDYYIYIWAPSLPVTVLLIWNRSGNRSKYVDYIGVCIGLFSSAILVASVFNSFFHQHDWSLHVAFYCFVAFVQVGMTIGIDSAARGARKWRQIDSDSSEVTVDSTEGQRR